ncbi:TPA: restriction endonuclease subunit S [Shewanella algae]|uniref:restriction endonuclease subunit S n=1 Tax=Shewanella algae TaxID=38313 RepID=UPI00302A3788|nr:restriction endonuclease subunit S [Shewanella algae]
MSWPLIAIKDFCQTGSGGTPSRKVAEYYDGDIPWIKSGDLRENVVTKASEFITELAVKKSSAKLVPKGAILLAMYGATVGRMAMLGIDAATNQAVCAIMPDPNRANARYVYYALLNKVPEFLRSAVGGAQPNISQGLIKDTKIPLPPLAEQKRIAAILDKADALRRKRQQAIDLADQFLRSVFLDMFGDPVTNPNKWQTKPIKDLARVVTGNTPSRQEPENYGSSIEWIKSDNINTPDHYLTKAEEFLSDAGLKKGRSVPSGSVLITCIAGSPQCIGNAAIADREVSFNQQINALVPEGEATTEYLYSVALFGKKLIQSISTNAMKGMVSKGNLEKLLVPAPPLALQEKYSETFKDFLTKRKRQVCSLSQSESLFLSLSQQAFSGQL